MFREGLGFEEGNADIDVGGESEGVVDVFEVGGYELIDLNEVRVLVEVVGSRKDL